MERNTFQKFCPPGELYLDRYTMLDALNDGFTIPLSYQARLPQYHLKTKELKQFIKFEEEELATLTKEEQKILKRKIKVIKAFVKKPERVETIAKDIARHFIENVDGKFKALIVTASRLSCVRYKKALDEAFTNLGIPRATDYTEIVMTFSHRDTGEIGEYLQTLKEKYGKSRDISDITKDIIRRFKEEEYPKLLIVTDMLITGFDYPKLQTLYLDKPVKNHLLLQTVARVNRPSREKEAGLIVDYVGILEDYGKALAFYEKEDYTRISESFSNIDKFLKEFEILLKETEQIIGIDRYIQMEAKR